MTEFAVFLVSMILLGVLLVFCITVDLVSVVRKRRIVKPVEFFAPKGYSPIDVALSYSARRVKADALFTPLLLYWADQGYVAVEEDGRGLKITKQKELPFFDSSERANKDTYECEETLFCKLFSEGKTFYTLAARSSVTKTYDEEMEECKKLSRSVVGKTGKRLSFAMKAAAAIVLIFSGILMSCYTEVPVALLMLFPLIGSFFIKFMPAPFYIRVPFMLVWGGVPLLMGLFVIPMPSLFKIALGAGIAVLLLVIFVFAEQADFRDEAELRIYGKVCSFKRFLVLADKHRLELLVEDYPDYFYDVLPYFYVFGITKKMKAKFDRIIPDGSLRLLGPIRDTYLD